MLHQRMRFKLGEDKNHEKTGINKITEGKIDDPVIPPKLDGGLVRTEVRGCRRFPSPPARIIAKTPLMDLPMDETVDKKRF